jgi:hypothetical protein
VFRFYITVLIAIPKGLINDFPTERVSWSVFLFAPLKYSSIKVCSFITTTLVISYIKCEAILMIFNFSNVNFLCWNLPIFSWFNRLNFNLFFINFITGTIILFDLQQLCYLSKPRSVLNRVWFHFKLMFSFWKYSCPPLAKNLFQRNLPKNH